MTDILFDSLQFYMFIVVYPCNCAFKCMGSVFDCVFGVSLSLNTCECKCLICKTCRYR